MVSRSGSSIAIAFCLLIGFAAGGSAQAFTAGGTLGFTATSYAFNVTAGTASIVVTRTGSATGAASVKYIAFGGTARDGVDYQCPQGALNWASGDTAPKTFIVKILHPADFSSGKTFTAHLWGEAGAVLGAAQDATVTINGGGTAPSTVSLSAPGYSVARTAGSITVSVKRAAVAGPAASVNYATVAGTAAPGLDYATTQGTLAWAAGDESTKSIRVPIYNPAATSNSRAFGVTLSTPVGMRLGTPATATVTITGAGAASAGLVELSASSYSVAQDGKAATLSIGRIAGSAGAASVRYATAPGTAVSGVDFSNVSNVLTWANGDTSVKNIDVPILSTAPFSGTKALTVNLTSPSGASVGTPSIATVNIKGTATASACSRTSSSWVTTNNFDSKAYGNYMVNNNNWGNLPGQELWVNGPDCWGVTTAATTDVGSILSYPSVTRGWTQNDTMMLELSTPGTSDWTTKSGMGIAVTALTKAKIHWQFTPPTTPGIRWMGLMDIYFHQSPNPSFDSWPPFVDLMIDQSLADQVVNTSTYYALVAGQAHATTVTLGGNKYLIYIDAENSYHATGGHTIHLFMLPTAYTSGNAGPLWGVTDAVTDVATIVKYFMQSHPVDDAGAPLQNAVGTVITAPLITPDLFLNAINAGWEIDDGTPFTNRGFCVAMQNEPDCP
jgi:Calx-beta domain-containing protein